MASSFEELVSRLSAAERKALLERIKASIPVSGEPLYPASSAPKIRTAAATKEEEIGLMTRLILFLRALFSGKSRDELVREDELKAIAYGIEQRQAGLIDKRRGLLLGSIVDELKGLRDAARFFYEALERSVDRDKVAFCAFLGSVELPETHDRLLSEANPHSIAASLAELRGKVEDFEVRNAALTAFDAIFSDLPERGRRSMYQDLRSVLFLRRLSGFLFERLIGAFKTGLSAEPGLAAPFFEVRELLLDLGDILFSMSDPPTIELMETIFFFAQREDTVRQGDDALTRLGADIEKAEASLGRIRSFNAMVPFGDLLRLVSGDPGYMPRDLPGGEDWLAIYKAFWRDRIEADMTAWRAEHRDRELLEEISAFVGDPGPAGFVNISREESESAPSLRYHLALVFLDAFFRGPFLREINRPLKIVLVDGEFYRKDNRVEFTDAFDSLLRLPELLPALDARLGPQGDIGMAWRLAMKELGPAAVKRRKTMSIARLLEEEAEQIVKREGVALRTIVHIIRGFMKGEAGGRYDSLANLALLDNKASNKDFLRSLDRAKDRCERALYLLSEVSGLDLTRED